MVRSIFEEIWYFAALGFFSWQMLSTYLFGNFCSWIDRLDSENDVNNIANTNTWHCNTKGLLPLHIGVSQEKHYLQTCHISNQLHIIPKYYQSVFPKDAKGKPSLTSTQLFGSQRTSSISGSSASSGMSSQSSQDGEAEVLWTPEVSNAEVVNESRLHIKIPL